MSDSTRYSNNGITARGLVRTFGDVRAVDGIDLDVKPGEIYGFLGRNGAGKSTTVLMLTTLLPPTAGTASVAGLDVVAAGPAVRGVIGAALQSVALDGYLTGREHLELIGRLHGYARPMARSRADELLQRVGLTEAADRKVGGYSGGMQRRLDLALALVHSPSVLFLDEPTTGLDPQSRTALWDEVRSLARRDGVTVFLTTQYMEEADALAERIGIIDRGRIVAEDSPKALKAAHAAPSVEVVPDCTDVNGAREVLTKFGAVAIDDTDPAACRLTVQLPDASPAGILTDVVRALDASNIPILEIARHEPTLDDVFLATTGYELEGSADEAGATNMEHDDELAAT